MDNEQLIKYFEMKRREFPILSEKINGKKLVYVDNSATTQKPKVVIDAITEYYLKYNSNVHRGSHTLANIATNKYEEVRGRVAKFISANKDEIVFTRGTTESLNMIAFGIEHLIKEGDEIVLSEMEHHANLVPWQEVAKRKKARLKFIPIGKDFLLDLKGIDKLITANTKIVSVSHISNVLGSINDIKSIEKRAHEVGAILIVDGAQSIPHKKIDVAKLNVDFFVFSAHKMCGPTGVGILYGKKKFLEKLRPMQYGGDMISEVKYSCSTYNEVPYRLEAGTPNIADVIAFGKAIEYLSEIGMENIENYEKILSEYFLDKISDIKGFELYGPRKAKDRGAVFSFNIKGVHSHDITEILDREGIAIRGGHHCAMPLIEMLEQNSTARISFYFYNTLDEIDYIVEVLCRVKDIYDRGEFLKS